MKNSILLIDHNDSFTYNIVETFRQLNCAITVINYDEITIEKVTKFEKIILSPGPMLPKNYTKTLTLIKTFYKTKPFLGICLGHQAICEFFNADLENLSQVRHGVEQEITINTDSKLYKNLKKKINVGLYHSWIVSKHNFPKELKITSETEDQLIMSFEHKKYPVYGIQFHPESFLTTDGNQILKNFIDL